MYDVGQLIEEPELLGPLARSFHELTPPVYLRAVKIKLTARCNLKCVMCRYGRGWAPPELSAERFSQILREMAELGCRKVHFSGGEVLARRDFEEVVEAASQSGVKVTLTSNLTLLTKARAKRLLAQRISGISTSLDGASAKVHESIRGVPGSFKRTLRGIEYVARYAGKRPPKLRVNFVMMRQNFRDYPALIQLVGERGAEDLVPMPVDTKRRELRLSKRLIREYNRDIAPEVRALRERYGLPLTELAIYPFGRDQDAEQTATGEYAGGYYREHPCYAPWLHLFVAWDGKVYLCCMTNGRIEPLGDLATEGVREVFQGPRFQAIRAEMKHTRLASCHACDMYLSENRELEAAVGSATHLGGDVGGDVRAAAGSAMSTPVVSQFRLRNAPSALPAPRRLPLV